MMGWMRTMAMTLAMAMVLPAAALGEENQLTLLPQETMEERFMANPHNVKNIGDPFVLPVEGGYDVFATGGPLGFQVWQSEDLITFNKARALQKVSWASGDYWAPEVFAYQGRYVMLYTARRAADGSLRMGVAFSDDPAGPYVDPLDAPLFDFGYAAIDGTLVVTPEGTPYMIYSRDCSENVVGSNHESHLYGVQLTEDLLATVGEPVFLTAPTLDWEILSGDYRWNEGPAVVQHEGKYYLYYSTNYYGGKEYSVGVAVADAPLGPYVKQDAPILQWIEREGNVLVSGPGHNSFFTVGEELFTAYHTHCYPLAPSGNRQLCVDRAGFHSDGTAYISGPTLAPQLRPLAELGLKNHGRTAANADALLTDGDICLSASSEAYLWHGQEAVFTWEEGVTVDSVLIYPAYGQALSGKLILDGKAASFTLGAEQKPGEALVLAFEETAVQEIRIVLDQVSALGEIMILGK